VPPLIFISKSLKSPEPVLLAIYLNCKWVNVDGIELNVTVFVPLPVAVAIDSKAGGGKVVMLLDAAEKGLFPVELDALTVKVYDVADVNPETVMGDEPVPVTDPGVEVAVNVVPVPPVVAAVYATVAVLDPVAVALPIVGASGTSTISVIAFTPSGVPSIRSSCALRILTKSPSLFQQ
jgi:hypothetical protein